VTAPEAPPSGSPPAPDPEAPAWQVAGSSGRDDHRILSGTASWTDPTMTAEGVFYPRDADTPEERLRYYSSLYPLVEVDATYYALPAERVAAAWARRTPPGFTFDVKAHALMTTHPTETKRLPKTIQNMLAEVDRAKARVYLRDLPDEAREALFGFFRDALQPLVEADKLGAILLQFPPWFFPSNESRDHIVEVRERLGLPVTVEFRHGSWFNEKNRDRTLDFLSKNALRAAGLQVERAAGPRGHLTGPRHRALPRSQRGDLGEEGPHAGRAVPLPLQGARTGGVGAARARSCREGQGDAPPLQ
jgi:uncharacterized protein YecE (DUF72 family)